MAFPNTLLNCHVMISEAGANEKDALLACHPVLNHERAAMAGQKHPQQATRASGIYQILCKANGKIYIGSAIHLPARWQQHQYKLRQGSHRNRHLQQAWSKYGEDAFEFTVLAYVEPADLLRIEQEWMNRTAPIEKRSTKKP